MPHVIMKAAQHTQLGLTGDVQICISGMNILLPNDGRWWWCNLQTTAWWWCCNQQTKACWGCCKQQAKAWWWCCNQQIKATQNGSHLRWHFQMHFLEQNFWISIQISLNFVHNGRIDKSTLVQVMASHQSGNKPSISRDPVLVSYIQMYETRLFTSHHTNIEACFFSYCKPQKLSVCTVYNRIPAWHWALHSGTEYTAAIPHRHG